jgi:hypothetical protein
MDRDEETSAKDLLAAINSISKNNAATAKALQGVMAVSRLNQNQAPPAQRHEHLHAHAVVPGAAPESVERTAKEKRERIEWLIGIHYRRSKPLEFEGMEEGIADHDQDEDSEEDGEAVGG